MSKNYDNWEKLVGAVLKKEQLRQIALCRDLSSSSSSSSSSSTSSFSSTRTSLFHHQFLVYNGLRQLMYPHPAQQFMGCFEVVEVDSVSSVDIRGKIKTRLLSPRTIYGAYLWLIITSANKKMKGLDSLKTMIRFVNTETDGDAETRADTVHLQPVDERKGEIALKREDEWMEVQIGNFYIDEDEGDDEEVEARVMKTTRWKTSLVVGGIEFRPLVCVRQV
ncbi:hypothetical protein ACP275_07G062900 [Erythranthe tilingii]